MWLGDAGDLAAGPSENEPSPAATPTTPPPIEQKPAKDDEAEEEKPVANTSESEIELPSPTPKPTPRATPTPKPATTPKPKRKRTPESTPRPTPKKPLVAKTSPKVSSKPKPASRKTRKAKETDKKSLVKSESASQKSRGKTGSTGKKGSAGGGNNPSEFAWYGNMLHDRFYRAWIQPTTNITTGAKISTLVKVRIDKDGHVSKFEIVKPSGNVSVNESIRVVAKQVTQVDAPPTGLIKGDHYDVNINFELNTEDKTTN